MVFIDFFFLKSSVTLYLFKIQLFSMIKMEESMYRMTVWFFFLVMGLAASAASAQTISLSGKVSNQSGKAISSAIVTLSGQKLVDTTDAAGAYSFSGGTALTNPSPVLPSSEKISFANGIVALSLTQPAAIGIEIFDIKGNVLERVFDHAASAGDYRFDIMNRQFASSVMLIRVSIGQRASTFRYVPMENGKRMVAASVTPYSNVGEGLTKSLAVVDSLKVTASGYVAKAVAVSSYQGTVNIALDSIALAKFSFFVTSLKAIRELSGSTNGFGGDLRFGKTGPGAGLLGADSICQCIAERSMPGSKVKVWRAFLSVTADASGKQVNAIDRIGTGPWYDRLGRLFGSTLADLKLERPNADAAIKNDFPNEDGVPNHQPDPTQAAVDNHDFLTGTNAQGQLYSATATCLDWTSAVGNRQTSGRPRVGHSWPRGGMGGGGMGSMNNWMSALDEGGCGPGINLSEASVPDQGVTVGCGGGYGGFYCFALNP
jgi:hypothetical protein